jgi:hypothetical protein
MSVVHVRCVEHEQCYLVTIEVFAQWTVTEVLCCCYEAKLSQLCITITVLCTTSKPLDEHLTA